MSSRHERTLAAVFEEPTRANILWSDIAAMLVYYGATLREGAGSRVRVSMNGHRVTLHRPHPQKEANRYTVRDVRAFLILNGIVP
ncbi:type II toxin-antitoxin system HicA family toxin [Longimicrobium sp.]|uniref:type II toxin-antitoxin system HicA family toxin n=1 Tax=Longimicrobium sp. TaxID=2029185 RepID=UPI002BE56D09|nr:type II toxin-antitoxin system HicA family toxin [Longimicrobium sp.]HSU16660.1 type II toxin-antitoxin system HicA family toxin [Longimicrobium sp.]